MGGTMLLGSAGQAQAAPGSQDEWNALFGESTTTDSADRPAGSVYSHAEGRDPSQLLTIHGDWKVTQNATVNGRLSFGNPDAPAYMPGNVNVLENSTLTVTGGLATQGELTLGEALDAGIGKDGTLLLQGATKDSARLDIAGSVTVGRDGGGFNIAIVPISTGGKGNLHLDTGIATFQGDLAVGGSSANLAIPDIDYDIVPQGIGGAGTLTVGKDAELHMQAGSLVKFGGDASSGYNIPVPVVGSPVAIGSPGGDAVVESSGYMRLGHVTMGGDAGSAANASGVIPSLTMIGGFGGDADLKLHKGSVTIMESLKAGGSGGDGGDGGDAYGSPPGPGGWGGIGGHGGYGKVTVNGSLIINGATTLGADHGSMGGAGGSLPAPPSADIPGGQGGLMGYAGFGRIVVENGGDITLGNSFTSNHHVEISTDLIEAAALLAGQLISDSYLEIGKGGTLKLTDTQSRDLVYSSYLLGAHKGLAAESLISGNSSGTIRLDGGTVQGNDLSASQGLELSTSKVNAHVVTDRFTVGTADEAKSVTIKNGLSLTITGTSGYLLSSADEAVTLDGGKLDVGGDIALMSGGKVALINAGYEGTSDQTVDMKASSGSHMVTQGKALAGDAEVNLDGNSLTAKVLDTTTKRDGSTVADGQNVTVKGNVVLNLTQDVSQGNVLLLGNAGNLDIGNNGTLQLTGNVTMGKVNAGGAKTTVDSLSGVQKGTGAITFDSAASTLKVTGTLGYNGALTVGGPTATGENVFTSKVVAGGISAKALNINNSGDVTLTGFADAKRNFLNADTSIVNGSLTLGGTEGMGGTSSSAITLGDGASSADSLNLLQGNFTTGAITTTAIDSAIAIGHGSDIGSAGSLTANVDVQKGSLTVNNTATDGGLYTIKGTVAIADAGKLTFTKGNLAIDGTLNYNSAVDLTLNGYDLAVKALNLAGQTVTTGAGTLAMNTLASTGTANINASGGTLDLGAQNIKDLSKMGAGTHGGVIEGYAGSFTINDSTVKTTGTASYTNDAALNLNKIAGASSNTYFTGALHAGVLEAKNSTGAAQDVDVSHDSLTLYGNKTAFLNASTLTIENGGTVNLGAKDYALGGVSEAKVALGGGALNVKGGMFTFTADKAFTTSDASSVNIDNGGVLAFTKQAVDSGLTGNIAFKVGTGLQSDASATAGNLLIADPASLNSTHVTLALNQGVAVMGGTGTVDDLRWVADTMNKWGVSSPAVLAITGTKTVNMRDATLKVGSDGRNHFGDNSLTMVDVTHFDLATPALALDGAATSFGKDARLLLTGKLVDGNQHTILTSGLGYTATDIKDTWSVVGDPNRLISITTAFGNGDKDIIANVKVANPESSMPGLSTSMGSLMQAMARDPNFGFDVNSGNAGVRFLSRTAHADFAPDGKQAAVTAEGAGHMASVANVAGSTMGASGGAATNAVTRLSFTTGSVDTSKATALHQDADGTLALDSGLAAGGGMKNGLGLWLMPMYEHNSTYGLKAGEFKTGSTSDLFGISVGADYTFADAFRFGVALNLGGGNSYSNGDFNPTDSRFNFWGVALYGGWMVNNFGLSADVGYTSNFNSLTQELPSTMQMANLKADVTSNAWTAGLRGEYKFATSALDIIPHIGVRYTGITTDEYDVKSAGSTIFQVEQNYQSLWTFPVGVTLSKQFDSMSGWSFTPKMDLGIIAAAGDVETKSRTSIPGLSATAEMESQTVDYFGFNGGLGFDVKNDSLSFGLNYNIQASEHRTGHGLFGTMRYEF